ncbi:uncharacterized protein BXZ73DRAFT_105983 [Epithele typhae]|uniref:uncharacterized protein n=1 Tax=Epithele typhae TaxID=378194 RepID=UPI00200858FE|nr:uncharacterized protein BXZ73DRAFT_108242 [Epithele typhae]XP_047873200.1 uncharacterized protein BXZ73DRAFT_105983 [Epithele typhae]KAH9911126.1 hypothetical protein BXZ73DRAFT_108242 [Epithele typhae]KAH9916124.1 hypothetical protein BXZ73DRAFT_105983 [Epithele typhae]
MYLTLILGPLSNLSAPIPTTSDPASDMSIIDSTSPAIYLLTETRRDSDVGPPSTRALNHEWLTVLVNGVTDTVVLLLPYTQAALNAVDHTRAEAWVSIVRGSKLQRCGLRDDQNGLLLQLVLAYSAFAKNTPAVENVDFHLFVDTLSLFVEALDSHDSADTALMAMSVFMLDIIPEVIYPDPDLLASARAVLAALEDSPVLTSTSLLTHASAHVPSPSFSVAAETGFSSATVIVPAFAIAPTITPTIMPTSMPILVPASTHPPAPEPPVSAEPGLSSATVLTPVFAIADTSTAVASTQAPTRASTQAPTCAAMATSAVAAASTTIASAPADAAASTGMPTFGITSASSTIASTESTGTHAPADTPTRPAVVRTRFNDAMEAASRVCERNTLTEIVGIPPERSVEPPVLSLKSAEAPKFTLL